MLQTERKKVDEKSELIYLVSMFSSWVMVRKLSKKVHFLQFCADHSLLKQFTYMHQKVLITLFQRMLWL